MSVVSYILEEILLTFTALSSIHTVWGFDLFQLGAVAGVALLCALAGVAAVTGLAGLVAFAAFAAGALAAVTGGGRYTSNVTGVCAVAGGVAAVAGVLHQRQVCVTLSCVGPLSDSGVGGGLLLSQEVWLAPDLCAAAVVLCAQDFDDTCKLSNPTLMQRISRA